MSRVLCSNCDDLLLLLFLLHSLWLNVSLNVTQSHSPVPYRTIPCVCVDSSRKKNKKKICPRDFEVGRSRRRRFRCLRESWLLYFSAIARVFFFFFFFIREKSKRGRKAHTHTRRRGKRRIDAAPAKSPSFFFWPPLLLAVCCALLCFGYAMSQQLFFCFFFRLGNSCQKKNYFYG